MLVLREQGRIQHSAINAYNSIIERYIRILANNINDQHQYDIVELIVFQIVVGLLGEEKQMGVLTDVVIGIKDDNLQTRFNHHFQKYYRREAQEKFQHFLTMIGLYDSPLGRVQYQDQICQYPNITPTDQEKDRDAMAVFKWMFKEKNQTSLGFFTRTLAFYLEYLKKLMIEQKQDAAQALINDYMTDIKQNAWMKKMEATGCHFKSLDDTQYYLKDFGLNNKSP